MDTNKDLGLPVSHEDRPSERIGKTPSLEALLEAKKTGEFPSVVEIPSNVHQSARELLRESARMSAEPVTSFTFRNGTWQQGKVVNGTPMRYEPDDDDWAIKASGIENGRDFVKVVGLFRHPQLLFHAHNPIPEDIRRQIFDRERNRYNITGDDSTRDEHFRQFTELTEAMGGTLSAGDLEGYFFLRRYSPLSMVYGMGGIMLLASNSSHMHGNPYGRLNKKMLDLELSLYETLRTERVGSFRTEMFTKDPNAHRSEVASEAAGILHKYELGVVYASPTPDSSVLTRVNPSEAAKVLVKPTF